MKTKKIIDLCKKSKRVVLFNDNKNDMQWISDGSAIYPLLNVPTLNEDHICKLYDISDSQRDKMFFKIYDELPKDISFDDSIEDETVTNLFDISIVTDGGILLPIMTEEGLMFIQSRYLAPFSDFPKAEIALYARKDIHNRTVFAVKVGLLLYALIYPIEVVNEDFVNKFEKIYHASVARLKNMS